MKSAELTKFYLLPPKQKIIPLTSPELERATFGPNEKIFI